MCCRGSEGCESDRRSKGAARKSKGRLEREAVRVPKPRINIFEEDRFLAADAVASRQSNLASPAVHIDMNFEVRHRGTMRMAV